MQQTSINLRFLLWREQVPRPQWALQLAGWAGCDMVRAMALLNGASLQPNELRQVVDVCRVADEDLLYATLEGWTDVDILQENVRYLTENLEHGGKTHLAEHLGVHPATISRWRNGSLRPSASHVKALHEYFQLPHGIDMATEPIFLWLGPITTMQRKTWLHQRIDDLTAATLKELFLALERLLEKP